MTKCVVVVSGGFGGGAEVLVPFVVGVGVGNMMFSARDAGVVVRKEKLGGAGVSVVVETAGEEDGESRACSWAIVASLRRAWARSAALSFWDSWTERRRARRDSGVGVWVDDGEVVVVVDDDGGGCDAGISRFWERLERLLAGILVSIVMTTSFEGAQSRSRSPPRLLAIPYAHSHMPRHHHNPLHREPKDIPHNAPA